MGLTFDSSGRLVTVTSNAGLSDLGTWSALMWVRRSSSAISGGQRLFAKGTNGTSQIQLAFNGTSGDLRLIRTYTASNVRWITNNTPLSTTNKHYFVAGTYDAGPSAGSAAMHIYVGSLTASAAECTYGTTDNSGGTPISESGQDLIIGNVAAAGSQFPGDISVFAFFNRTLTLGEILSWQFNPRIMSGCMIFMHLGYNGTGTQPDWSGNGNSGAVTGAVQAAHVPLGPAFGRDEVLPYSVPVTVYVPKLRPQYVEVPVAHDYLWWEQFRLSPLQTFLPAPFPRQRSQRIESLPDAWHYWVPRPIILQADTIPIGRLLAWQADYPTEPNFLWWQFHLQPLQTYLPPPPLINPQRSQRHDPLPVFDGVWWQAYAYAHDLTVPPGAHPPTRQPEQQHSPLPVHDYLWWEQFRLQTLQTFLPTPFPRQRSQRHDSLPDYLPEWQVYNTSWPVPVEYVPSPVPTRQQSQRQDPLPDLTDYWQQHRTQPVPVTFVPMPFPRQRDQRVDFLQDQHGWQQPGRSLPAQPAFAFLVRQYWPDFLWEDAPHQAGPVRHVRPTNRPTKQNDQRIESLPDVWQCWDAYSYTSRVVALPSGHFPPTRQPSQRQDEPRNLFDQWDAYSQSPFSQWYVPERPTTRQPSQRVDPLPVYDYLWWEQFRLQPEPITYIPPTPQFVRPPFPVYEDEPWWWYGNLPVKVLPPSVTPPDPVPISTDTLEWSGLTNLYVEWEGRSVPLLGVIGLTQYRLPVRVDTPQVIGPYTFRDLDGQIINLNAFTDAGLLVKRQGQVYSVEQSSILQPTQEGRVQADSTVSFPSPGVWDCQFYLVDSDGVHYYGESVLITVVPNVDGLTTNQVPQY